MQPESPLVEGHESTASTLYLFLLLLILSSQVKHNKLQIFFWAHVPLPLSPYIPIQQKDHGGYVYTLVLKRILNFTIRIVGTKSTEYSIILLDVPY